MPDITHQWRDSGWLITDRIFNFQERLAETKDKRLLSHKQLFRLFCLRLVTNLVCLALIGCATYLIVEVIAGYSAEVRNHNTCDQDILITVN